MDVLGAALFRLAFSGRITVGEAKVLKAIHENRACSEHSLVAATGLEKADVKYALWSLKGQGIVDSSGVFYFVPDFELALAKLIDRPVASGVVELAVARS